LLLLGDHGVINKLILTESLSLIAYMSHPLAG
jgi:hypothetical protein